ncbi:hypothetical protein ACVRZH_01195 [Streptococcus fryi]
MIDNQSHLLIYLLYVNHPLKTGSLYTLSCKTIPPAASKDANLGYLIT